MLQSVFIIRSYNDVELRNNSSIELVVVSLAASLFSISNKYTWIDKEGFYKDAQTKNGVKNVLASAHGMLLESFGDLVSLQQDSA